jgi:uncharacterized iron-regulated membrane protein
MPGSLQGFVMAVTRIGLRRAWFEVHKWIGLVLAILLVPLSLSGAALVWHDALDRALNPQRYTLTNSIAGQAPQAYIAATAGVLAPGERITTLMARPAEPVVVSATQTLKRAAGAGRLSRTLIWLDPGSARVLDKADGQAGFVGFVHQLHGSMMLPGFGRLAVGWLGIAMLLSSLTGLWLWWPTVGRWTRGLRWARHGNFDTNLHHLFGFWIALPLFVLSLTGIWIAFPAVFGVPGGHKLAAQGSEARMRARPLEAPVQTLDGVLAAARDQAPGTVTAIVWPTDQKPRWSVTLKPWSGEPVTVAVDDASGDAAIDTGAGEGQGNLARTMRRIHDGTGMGLAWQVIIFLAGLLPAVLAISGVIMWWRARGWRGALEERRKAYDVMAG